MAIFFNGGKAYLNAAVVTAEPLTMAVNFNLQNNFIPESLIFVGSTTGGTSYFQIETNGDNNVFADKNSVFTGETTVTSSNTYSAGTWSKTLATFNNDGNKTVNVYLDGVAGTPAAANFNMFHSLDGTYISGRWFAGSYERPVTGCLAEAAIWNAVLTSSEINSYMSGFIASSIRPANLVFYAPLLSLATTNLNMNGASPPFGGPLQNANTSICTDHGPRLLTPTAFDIYNVNQTMAHTNVSWI